jgi:aminoglycoside phosphotransferase family enzyme
MSEATQRRGDDIPLHAKIEAMRRPETYSERPTRIEAIETHMAWVFLTDRHAYKLKKPVRYPYLDFATLEARYRDSEDEVRLNRRLAADVYLGIEPLVLSHERLRVGGEGEPVEWLVKMRRLPRGRMLDRAIETGRVEVAQAKRLGRLLTRFYRQAARVKMGPETYRGRIASDIEANRDELLRPSYGLPANSIRRIAATLLRTLRSHPEWFDERVARELIVEAHGDLRPEHICLLSPPVIIDCLEFNRDFRLLDPADELAFLALECERLGAPWVGRVVLDVYAGMNSDRPPTHLLAFFKAHRATLRAKIAALHLRDAEVAEPEKWVERANEYLRLAEGYAARLEPRRRHGG